MQKIKPKECVRNHEQHEILRTAVNLLKLFLILKSAVRKYEQNSKSKNSDEILKSNFRENIQTLRKYFVFFEKSARSLLYINL